MKRLYRRGSSSELIVVCELDRHKAARLHVEHNTGRVLVRMRETEEIEQRDRRSKRGEERRRCKKERKYLSQ